MKTEISHNESLKDGVFSKFGPHHLDDGIILSVPNNTITLKDIGDGKFSYIRNSDIIIKKIIQTNPQTSQIEIAPVLPVHIPSHKTDFFFIRFDESLFIEKNSTMQIEICIPIEIGVFLITQDTSSILDFFSCDPLNSRFGLYGTPEDGKLCKYYTTSASGNDTPIPFMHARFKITITNELHESATIGKIVFPITDHDLYYHNNETIMDGLHAIIKNRVGLHVIETIQDPIVKPADWRLTPRDIEKTDYKFSMERGFE
jgi:hypothetical protein